MTEIHLSEEKCRELADWAGRKLGKYWLGQLSKAHAKRDRARFDKITEQLFGAQTCTDDSLLQSIMGEVQEDARLDQFRNVLWRHVAPAIAEYTDQPFNKRVELHLSDLRRFDQDAFERFRTDKEVDELSVSEGMAVPA